MPELGVSPSGLPTPDALARARFLDQIQRYVAEGSCQDLLVLVAALDDGLQARLAVQDFRALAHAACTGLTYAIERSHGAPAHARVYRGDATERVTRARDLGNPENGASGSEISPRGS